MRRSNRIAVALTLAAIVIAAFAGQAVAAKPLKVYILAGQSNMEGHARIETFDHIGDDPNAGYHYLGCAKTLAPIRAIA